MNDPKHPHFVAAKRILRYLHGTLDHDIMFQKPANQNLIELFGFSNSDWCGDKVDRRSTSGYLFKFLNSAMS